MKQEELKKILLKNNINQETLSPYLEVDYYGTIKAILSIIHYLIKVGSKRTEKILQLVETLEMISISNLNKRKIRTLNNLIAKFEIECQEQLPLSAQTKGSNIITRILDISTDTQNKKIDEQYHRQIGFIMDLMSNKINLDYICNYLSSCTQILKFQNHQGQTIFDELLIAYCNLPETEIQTINNYYRVLSTFWNKELLPTIIDQSNNYLALLENPSYKDKKHVAYLKKILEQTPILEEEIADFHQVRLYPSDQVRKELTKLSTIQIPRIDYSFQNVITIDDESSICLDDAIYLGKNHNGTYTLYIHITDIPSLVPYNSRLNQEAYQLGETIYLPGKNISIYPKEISYNKASLLPNQPRNVLTYKIEVDSNFDVLPDTLQIIPSRIQVKRRMTYQEVDNLICSTEKSELHSMLNNLAKICMKLRYKNPNKEVYRKIENLMVYNSKNASNKIDYSYAANIVQESMILVNHLSAQYFKDKGYPYLYRILTAKHLEPEMHRILQLIQGKDAILSENMYRNIQNTILSPSYSSLPLEHSGLSLTPYSHSTSPARRYSDGYIQYLTYSFLFTPVTDHKIYKWEAEVKQVAEHLNNCTNNNEMFSKTYRKMKKNAML